MPIQAGKRRSRKVVLPVWSTHGGGHAGKGRIARSCGRCDQEVELSTKGVAAMTTTYTVRAVKWSGGWELHIGDIGVTQVRTLDKAAAQVRDYLETLHDEDMKDVEIVVVPALNGLEKEVVAARREVSEAAKAQRHAAERSRAIARELRATGLSVTDTAAVLGISRGRVSQLIN